MVTPSWPKSEKKGPSPETKFLPGANVESRVPQHHQPNAPNLQRLGQKVGSGLKRLFQCPQVDDVCIIQTQDTMIELRQTSGVSCREKLLLTLGVFIVLLVVVLLLLWNYKCTIIDRLCQGNPELLTPLFKDD
ncbi:hypothetical protein XELAEV_18041411mg [Xenopus laevis]|uniref:Uncharacterized protein n=1 Tax=Xenopus laevis TaxID=8355 RepID=A0A974C2D0_XENLA|nr:hypothetical protein XELAEV_18041411mg [Xenopus laevis]